ncbi:ribonuclease III [Balneola sp. MJW-20]|uniref:ribonuclease III n=1 Tax=Gracilimonas aurantiaca TaxID=3234185 RepID=UPI003909640E
MIQWFRSIVKKKSDLDPELQVRIENLERIIGLTIDDPSLYLKALRHRSTISKDEYESYDSYERLEFLGDAVLDLIAAEILFQVYPKANEGFLTKIRAKLVRGETLSKLTARLGIDNLMEFGERTSKNKVTKNIMADVFESIIAAIYITNGYEKAYEFVERVIENHLDLDELINTVDNYKRALLEYTQAKKLAMPDYQLITETGPGHDRTFEVAVKIGEDTLGTGTGKSKKKAEQAAAKEALDALQ